MSIGNSVRLKARRNSEEIQKILFVCLSELKIATFEKKHNGLIISL
jgi:hypothetical protein